MKKIWWNRILIWWIEWVWKTSIIKWCLEKDKNLSWYFFWEEFVKEAKKDENFDWFENLTIDQRKKIENKINKNVENLPNENSKVLFDAHFTILQNWEYINCNEDKFIEDNFDCLVLIKLRSDEIIKRIKSDDKDRTSVTEDISKVENHAKLEEIRWRELAEKCNLELFEIENLDLNTSIKKILEIISDNK